jgi:hypothetical protein
MHVSLGQQNQPRQPGKPGRRKYRATISGERVPCKATVAIQLATLLNALMRSPFSSSLNDCRVSRMTVISPQSRSARLPTEPQAAVR